MRITIKQLKHLIHEAKDQIRTGWHGFGGNSPNTNWSELYREITKLSDEPNFQYLLERLTNLEVPEGIAVSGQVLDNWMGLNISKAIVTFSNPEGEFVTASMTPHQLDELENIPDVVRKQFFRNAVFKLALAGKTDNPINHDYSRVESTKRDRSNHVRIGTWVLYLQDLLDEMV